MNTFITGKVVIPFVNEFHGILKYCQLLESNVTLSDAMVDISDVDKEFQRIANQFRLIEKGSDDNKRLYFDFQRGNALPLYRRIIKLCLINADKRTIKIDDEQRSTIIKILMERMDILIAEIDIINPPSIENAD